MSAEANATAHLLGPSVAVNAARCVLTYVALPVLAAGSSIIAAQLGAIVVVLTSAAAFVTARAALAAWKRGRQLATLLLCALVSLNLAALAGAVNAS